MFADKIVYFPAPRSARLPLQARLGARARNAWLWLQLAVHNHATRLRLRDLDDRDLADLGLSRAQAEFESARWFWDSRVR